MNQKHCPIQFWEGTLPPVAPLANGYVPYQEKSPEMHELPLGFIRGTIYAGLDLPFKNSVNHYPKKQNCRTRLQQTKFALQEMGLYLDTHPNDQEALEQFSAYEEMCTKEENEYCMKYGPIRRDNFNYRKNFSWENDPWPWEYMR